MDGLQAVTAVSEPTAASLLRPLTVGPADILRQRPTDQLRNAIDAAESDLLTYESLRNLSEVIGGEYGDRVIFELVQNANDAHEDGASGAIRLKLVVLAKGEGDLYVANGGRGFDWSNVNAIRNVVRLRLCSDNRDGAPLGQA